MYLSQYQALICCYLDISCVCVCVLDVYNKAQTQRISNREFKLWTFLQGTESRVATFLAETCVMCVCERVCVSESARLQYFTCVKMINYL